MLCPIFEIAQSLYLKLQVFCPFRVANDIPHCDKSSISGVSTDFQANKSIINLHMFDSPLPGIDPGIGDEISEGDLWDDFPGLGAAEGENHSQEINISTMGVGLIPCIASANGFR
jgi:hypothetical protein